VRRQIFIGLSVVLVSLVATIWGFFSYTERLFDRRVHKLEVTFVSDRSQLEALAELWPHLHKTMDSCGGPSISPGLVHFAAIERTSNGRIRVVRDTISSGGFDVAVLTPAEAATKVGAAKDDLLRYLEKMHAISITGAYQHDAELHLVQDDDGTLSLMYVPPTCKQYAEYPFWDQQNRKNELTPFTRIHQLAPSWFLVEENR